MLRKVLAAVVVCLVTLGGTLLTTTTTVGASKSTRPSATVTLTATYVPATGKYDMNAIVSWKNFPYSVNFVTAQLLEHRRTVSTPVELQGNFGYSNPGVPIHFTTQGERGHSYMVTAQVTYQVSGEPIFHMVATSTVTCR
jgi:hypothetical protein